jgi:PAS domain S-box-containing protein
LPVILAELPTTRVIEVSPKAAELLGATPPEAIGSDFLAIAERPEQVAITAQAMAAGALDSFTARRRLRRADGSPVEVVVCVRAIRSAGGPDLAIGLVYEARGDEVVTEAILAGPSRSLAALEPRRSPMAAGTLDHHWRVEKLSADVKELLGYRPADLVGTSVFSAVHPDDLAALLLAFAQATSEASVGLDVRLRHRDGSWRPVRAGVTLLDRAGRPHFGFLLGPIEEPGAPDSGGRVGELERHLRRIAAEVQGAGVLHAVEGTVDLQSVPALSELSVRQWEVLTRLVRGERVPTIASEMYLSQSTVRNHLSAIFRKVGVHSQEELLAVVRDGK